MKAQQKWDGSKFQFDFFVAKKKQQLGGYSHFDSYVIWFLGSNHKLKLQTCGFEGGLGEQNMKNHRVFWALGMGSGSVLYTFQVSLALDAAVDRFWRISKPQLIGQQASRDKDGCGAPAPVYHQCIYCNFLGILGDYI